MVPTNDTITIPTDQTKAQLYKKSLIAKSLIAMAVRDERRYQDAILEMQRPQNWNRHSSLPISARQCCTSGIGDSARAAQESAKAKQLDKAQIRSAMLQNTTK